MRKFDSRPRVRDTVLLTGWLFADLLLALAVLFLAANTVGVKPQPIPTVVPTPTLVPTPSLSPTPLPRLELTAHRIKLHIDAAGLLSNSQSAINDLEHQLRTQSFLQGRDVGLAIVYGGAQDSSQVDNALAVASKVYSVLRLLGQQGFAFTRASMYDPLFTLNTDNNTITLDIFVFAK
jgi:hypothetical protein